MLISGPQIRLISARHRRRRLRALRTLTVCSAARRLFMWASICRRTGRSSIFFGDLARDRRRPVILRAPALRGVLRDVLRDFATCAPPFTRVAQRSGRYERRHAIVSSEASR